MRLVLLGAVYLLFIVFLAYKHYEYPFLSVLGKTLSKSWWFGMFFVILQHYQQVDSIFLILREKWEKII